MSSLVPRPSIVPPAPADAGPTIVNDGFFPDVDPNALRLQARVRETVLPERLREAVLAAMMTIANDLQPWRETKAAAVASLDEVPSTTLGGESRLIVLYRRALTCFVKAELIERNRDFDQTGAGQRDVQDLDGSAEELRRDARHAIRDFLGRPRNTVALI
ncbi:MAG TPA: head completion/stabilization protein [Allosphingosinicella sp.]